MKKILSIICGVIIGILIAGSAASACSIGEHSGGGVVIGQSSDKGVVINF